MYFIMHQNQLTMSKLVVIYRKSIAQNLVCQINRIFNLEPFTVSTNYMCSIVIPISL